MKRRRTLNESLEAAQAAEAKVADSFEEIAATGEAEPRRRGVLVRVSPALLLELKLLSAHRAAPVQALMLEAINDLMVKSGRPPIA